MSMTNERPLVVFILGPTASGKTAAASMLYEEGVGDLISVDSAMVYRGMDIGTAKPTPAELARAPHRLIDIRDPAEGYSAAEFRRDAIREINAIHAAGRVPLLVGGTMLYFKTLLEGNTNLPAASPEVRSALAARLAAQGLGALHAELARVDPASGARIHPNDTQRTLRALEVYHQTGVSLSDHWQRQSQSLPPWRVLTLALAPAERHLLHQRIETRFNTMLEQGFVEEVTALRARGDLRPDMPSMRCVGYRQAWSYLAGDDDFDTFCYKAIAATRQLAKRQITWLRSWRSPLVWCDMTAQSAVAHILKTVRDAHR